MTTIYCPFLGGPSRRTNVEHIFQESIGGGRQLSIHVDMDTNSRWGSHVDHPFVDHKIVQFFRVLHAIPGGHLDADVNVAVGSLSHEVRLRLTRDGVSASARPFQEAIGKEGWLTSFVGDSPDACEEAHRKLVREQLNHKARKRGGSVVLIDQQQFRLSVSFPAAQHAEMHGDVVYRALAKTVLGGTAWLFGEGWRRGVFAKALRDVVNGSRQAFEFPLLATAYRAGDRLEDRLSTPFLSSANEHELAFASGPDGSVWCFVTVFHFFGARFRVHSGLEIPPIGWGMNVNTRDLRPLLLGPNGL